MRYEVNGKTISVLVTTAHKGVFFGLYPIDGDRETKTVTITQAQMAVYWPAEQRGVLGLASTGPIDGCRITPAVPEITLHEVTSITKTTPEAAEAWSKAPWR